MQLLHTRRLACPRQGSHLRTKDERLRVPTLRRGLDAHAGHSDHQRSTRPSLRHNHAFKRSAWCLAATSRSTGLERAVGTWAWLTRSARIAMASGCTTSRTRTVTQSGTICPRWDGNRWRRTKRHRWPPWLHRRRACPWVRHQAHNLLGRHTPGSVTPPLPSGKQQAASWVVRRAVRDGETVDART